VVPAAAAIRGGKGARHRERTREFPPPVIGFGTRSVPPREGHEGISAIAVSKHFAGITALQSVDLTLTTGKRIGLIGPNGSGKTTLVNILSGFVKPTSGLLTVGDHNVTGWPSYRIARLGVGRTFQHTRLFGRLTALENVEVGAGRARRHMSGRERRTRARATLEEVKVNEFAQRTAKELSFGIRRKVEIARALAAEPRFLLLDEPAAGVPEAERAGLASMIAGVAAQRGLGVLVIDHDLSFVSAICEHIVVLDAGSVIARGAPHVVADDPTVISAYIGAPISAEPNTHALVGDPEVGK
jgi:ABC-type branched-subunit amino acid transport system ATPase component